MTPAPNDTSVGDRTRPDSASTRPTRPTRWYDQPEALTFHQFRLDTPNSVFNDIESTPACPGRARARTAGGSFTLSSTLGPSVVNEARFAVQTYGARFANNNLLDG